MKYNGSDDGVGIPLTLPLASCWEIEQGRVDSSVFFAVLPKVFHEVTSAFFEGTSIASEVEELFLRFAASEPYLPEGQTVWPMSKKFHCRATLEFWTAVSQLAQRHAEPELCDHLFLYAEKQVILEWPDAFANTMWLSPLIEETRVAAFSKHLELRFRRAPE